MLLLTTIVGVGFTVTVTVVVDVQLPAVAVIVKVVVIGEVVLFTKVPLIVPDPLVPIPVKPAGVVLVQVNAVPVTALGLLSKISVIDAPEHIVCVAGVAATVGVGFTVTATVELVNTPGLAQLLPEPLVAWQKYHRVPI